MGAFILRRFAYALFLLFLASLLVFYGLRLAPGDIVSAIASPTTATVVRIDLTRRLGLDRPLAVQYFVFLRHLLEGDPGVSIVSGERITTVIRQAGPKTLSLGIAAAVLTYTLAIPLGVLAAARRNGLLDHGARFLVVLAMGIPNFFLAVLMIQLFGVELGWLPVAGPGGLKHLVLPAVALAVEAIALNLRLMRSSVLEELSSDYIRTLRAKGLGEGRIVWVHAFRNALPPVIALAGVILPTLLGYTLVVETIFRFEGLGYQLVQSIIRRDYALAQTLSLLFTALVILFNFLADVAHQVIDPRIREAR
jgi:peptide/nickel transport system permease protein